MCDILLNILNENKLLSILILSIHWWYKIIFIDVYVVNFQAHGNTPL